jgi:hypothetical protein
MPSRFQAQLAFNPLIQGQDVRARDLARPRVPLPGMGGVVRVNQEGGRWLMVYNLLFSTAMPFGPDGRLYISNSEILRVEVP